ncbi:MAG: GNAT family N-acetyltransferase [Gaiellaceae bacterium]
MLTATALELIVRDLRPDDWAEVAAIYRDGMRGGMATFETEVPRWGAWHEAHPLRVVAEFDERIVGWAALAHTSARWAYRGVGESSVYIARDERGKGVGRSLMEALIAKSEQAGFWTLQASIFPENEASLKLHSRVGFRVVGVQKQIAKRDGLWRDTVLMERRSEVIE